MTKTATVSFRVTGSERASLERRAKEAGLTLAQFAKEQALALTLDERRALRARPVDSAARTRLQKDALDATAARAAAVDPVVPRGAVPPAEVPDRPLARTHVTTFQKTGKRK